MCCGKVQWLCRVQLPTVWKAELATGMTLHGAVCQSPDGHGKCKRGGEDAQMGGERGM